MPTALRSGQRVDRYRVVRLVGSGGMAEVWEVAEADNPLRLALKVPRGESAERARGLLREGRAGGRLVHRNLLPVLDVIPVAGGAGLVLPLVDGPDLSVVLRHVQLPEAEALWLFREIVRGVAYAHGLGMVHRDLKPGNVLLDLAGGDLTPKVADFGLVKVLEPGEDRTLTGDVVGTPAYAAPEQLTDSSRVDARADLWSLGVIFVELLTGRKPFVGRGILEVFAAHDAGPALDGLSPAQTALARDLLARDPDLRTPSAEALLVALEALAVPSGLPADGALVRAAQALLPLGATPPPGPEERLDPSRAAPSPPAHQLPPERDAFVGRQRDLRELDGLLAQGARLVSVHGLGGAGKTRLVLRYGWTHRAAWPGGVYFCDLVEARSLDGVVSAVARALDVALGKGDPVKQLGYALAARGRVLVLLDNFEQVARHAEATLGRWLDATDEARFVVTTREILGLPDEATLPLPPLTPRDAAALFVARAARARPGYQPTADDLQAIDALVRLLDGLPLATELAAARMRLLSPRTMLERMGERFKLLSSNDRRHPRQATLRATLDWSWDLLTPDEQAALAQLSVFEGGFSLEAAESVLSLEQTWALDALQALVERSLVRKTGEDRCDLLGTVQAYASERLGGDRAAVEARHGAFFAEAAAGATLVELDNLVAACRRAVARGAGETAVPTLEGAWRGLSLRGPFAAGATLGEQVAAMDGLSLPLAGRARLTAGAALWRSGRLAEARVYLDEALTRLRAAGAGRDEAHALGTLGILHRDQGRMDEAQACYEAALSLARATGDRSWEAKMLNDLGNLRRHQGRRDEARAHFEASLALERALDNRVGEGIVLGNLGTLHFYEGRMGEAEASFTAALELARQAGDRRTEGITLGYLAVLHHNRGHDEAARPFYDAALALVREVGDRHGEASLLGELGNLEREQGRPDEARLRHEAALRIHQETGNRRGEGIATSYLGDLALERGALAEARARYEAGLRLHREVGNRRFEGAYLGKLGGMLLGLGELAEARASLEQGEALLRAVGDPDELGRLLTVKVRLHGATGDAAAARAALDEARSLAARIGAGPGSELARLIAGVAALS